MCDIRLTKEHLRLLARPFPAEKISFKVQATFGEDQGLIVAYIDARDVMDRLDEVAGGEWSDVYCKAPSGGLECALTVLGVTRRDVGEDDNKTEPEKSGYSDAFKRAAVKFGVGRFVYDLPKMYAKVEKRGTSSFLVKGEEARLRHELTVILARITPAGEPKITPPPTPPAELKPTPEPTSSPAPVVAGTATTTGGNGKGNGKAKPPEIKTRQWQTVIGWAQEAGYALDEHTHKVNPFRLLNAAVAGGFAEAQVTDENYKAAWMAVVKHYGQKQEAAA